MTEAGCTVAGHGVCRAWRVSPACLGTTNWCRLPDAFTEHHVSPRFSLGCHPSHHRQDSVSERCVFTILQHKTGTCRFLSHIARCHCCTLVSHKYEVAPLNFMFVAPLKVTPNQMELLLGQIMLGRSEAYWGLLGMQNDRCWVWKRGLKVTARPQGTQVIAEPYHTFYGIYKCICNRRYASTQTHHSYFFQQTKKHNFTHHNFFFHFLFSVPFFLLLIPIYHTASFQQKRKGIGMIC